MAKSTLVYVEQTVKVAAIQLTLTKEEADALRTIFNFIGGNPINTRRGLIDEVDKALVKAGARSNTSDV